VNDQPLHVEGTSPIYIRSLEHNWEGKDKRESNYRRLQKRLGKIGDRRWYAVQGKKFDSYRAKLCSRQKRSLTDDSNKKKRRDKPGPCPRHLICADERGNCRVRIKKKRRPERGCGTEGPRPLIPGSPGSGVLGSAEIEKDREDGSDLGSQASLPLCNANMLGCRRF